MTSSSDTAQPTTHTSGIHQFGMSPYHGDPNPTTLRALEPYDLDLLYAVENDPDTWSYTSTPTFYSHATLSRYIEEATGDIFTDNQLRLVATINTTPIGIIDLTTFDPLHMRAEVGILILPQHRGQGHAVGALQQLAAHARRLHLHQLYAIVATDNAPATATFKAAGFTPTARLTQWLNTAEGYTDAQMWQLIL